MHVWGSTELSVLLPVWTVPHPSSCPPPLQSKDYALQLGMDRGLPYING